MSNIATVLIFFNFLLLLTCPILLACLTLSWHYVLFGFIFITILTNLFMTTGYRGGKKRLLKFCFITNLLFLIFACITYLLTAKGNYSSTFLGVFVYFALHLLVASKSPK